MVDRRKLPPLEESRHVREYSCISLPELDASEREILTAGGSPFIFVYFPHRLEFKDSIAANRRLNCVSDNSILRRRNAEM